MAEKLSLFFCGFYIYAFIINLDEGISGIPRTVFLFLLYKRLVKLEMTGSRCFVFTFNLVLHEIKLVERTFTSFGCKSLSDKIEEGKYSANPNINVALSDTFVVQEVSLTQKLLSEAIAANYLILSGLWQLIHCLSGSRFINASLPLNPALEPATLFDLKKPLQSFYALLFRLHPF